MLNDDLVSRKHVKVRRDWAGTHVEDLGSRNGIKLNKQRARKATIKDRDELEIGGVRLLFLDPNEVREEPVIIPPSADDDEGTVSVKGESEEPGPVEAASQDEAPPPETSDDPVEADDPGVLPQSDDQPQSSDDEPVDEDPPGDEQPEEHDSPRLIDLSNKLHLFALGIGAAMVIVGVVLIILLAAGAEA